MSSAAPSSTRSPRTTSKQDHHPQRPTLMQHDADFAKFAARILLTYIYEEVLGWDIVRDGIEAAPRVPPPRLPPQPRPRRRDRAHLTPACSSSTSTASPTRSIRPPTWTSTSSASRPSTTATSSSTRRPSPPRIEAPQLFWMRVAMGLCGEKGPRGKIISLYRLYKPPLLLLDPDPLQLRHPAQPALLLLPLQGRRQHRVHHDPRHRRKRLPLQVGRRPRRLLDRVRGTGGYIKGTNGESRASSPSSSSTTTSSSPSTRAANAAAPAAPTSRPGTTTSRTSSSSANTGDDRRRAHDMNTANWIPDLFMKRMEARETGPSSAPTRSPISTTSTASAFEERYVAYEAESRRRQDLRPRGPRHRPLERCSR
jgi:ribonucleoside-diphosphate reductase alpha chain